MQTSALFVDQESMDDFLAEWNSSKNTIALLTSGSTGTKKHIQAEKKYLEASVQMTGQFFKFNKDTTALHCLPITFIAGKMMLLRIVAFQMQAYFCSPSHPLEYPEDLEIDFAAMTPYQYQKSLAQDEKKLTKIKTVLLGGAGISRALEEKIATLPHQVYHSYGMTETFSHVALRKVGEEKHFTALDDILFSTNTEGALVIHAPKLGHENLVTQDLVELLNDRQFRFRGRLDFVINSGGIKMHPEELEEKIAHLVPGLNYFFAGVSDDLLGEKLVLFVENEFMNLVEHLNVCLSRFERPKNIIFCDQFSYTDTGKLDRIKTIKTCLY